MNILSIDGGGIRGIIPMLLLIELEKQLGKPLYEVFDLVCGTSIGGILSLAINVPDENRQSKYSADDVYKIFNKNKKDIFDVGVINTFLSVIGIRDYKYNSEHFYNVLNKTFTSTKLSDVLCDVIIPGLDYTTNKLITFSSVRAKQSVIHDYYLKDVAYSSASAKNFFKPIEITNIHGRRKNQYIDATERINDPSLYAITDLIKRDDISKHINIVSIGTSKKIYDSHLSHVPSITEILFKTDGTIFDFDFDFFDSTINFSRLNPSLKVIKANDLSISTIKYIYSKTGEFIDINRNNIKNLSLKLKSNGKESKSSKIIQS